MQFRIDAKSFFLTYPHCKLEKDNALLQLRGKALQIDKYCVARENHADGTPHLHILIILERRRNVTNPHWFDLKRLPGDAGEDYHGNYQSCRKTQSVFEYCTKSDAEPLTNIVPAETWGMKGGAKRADIAKEILGGLSLTDAVEKYPQILFGFNRLKQDLSTYEEAKIEYTPLPNWIPNPWGILLPLTNQKRRHWWIYSTQPNKGKTTWAKEMQATYGAHIKSGDYTYWNITGRESMLILDEYNVAGLRYHVLNQIADGTFEFRVFLQGLRTIPTLRIVVVLSNQNLVDVYPHMSNLLMARFNIKCID